MAKTTAPLLSFGASGQIAKTMVASTWKGRPYMRRHVTPANPNTTAQQEVRQAFSFLNDVYKVAPTEVIDAWEAYVRGKVLTARNAFQKFNAPILRPAGGSPAANLDDTIMSPGALGGLPAATFTVTPGNDQLTLAATVPGTLPDGWSVYSVVFAILLDQDYTSPSNKVISAFEDTAAAYTHDFTGLASAATYQCYAWVKYLRPDGFYAYSPSSNDQGLTT